VLDSPTRTGLASGGPFEGPRGGRLRPDRELDAPAALSALADGVGVLPQEIRSSEAGNGIRLDVKRKESIRFVAGWARISVRGNSPCFV
jgi:hypothetical protein